MTFHFRSTVAIGIATALGAIAFACGGTPTPAAKEEPTGIIDPDASIVVDSGVEAEAGLGPDPIDPVYPSAHTAMPLVNNNGGAVLVSPKIVTITYEGDAKVTDLEALGDTITTTPWWDAVRAGYCDGKGNCIGQGTSGGHVHLSDTPLSNYTDSSMGGATTLQALIKGYVADGTFPPPDSDTLYVIYFPASVTINLDGSQSCGTFGGYHNSLTLTPPGVDGGAPGAPVVTAYAILPRCSSSEPELTLAASHEIIEAATDPQVPATFYMTNQLWAATGGEVGDLCHSPSAVVLGDDSYLEGAFTVQRIWSNKAAAASHDPCVPAPSIATSPYFNVAPAVGADQLSLKIGGSKTIELTAFSDAPLADWNIEALEFSSFQGGNNVLSFSIDRPTVHNGSKINLTVTLNAKPTSGFAEYAIVSKSGSTQHTWPMAVVQQ